MKEFKGIGDKIQIDGENLFIKSSFLKEECFLPHIEWVSLSLDNIQGRGKLIIVTDDKDVTWKIIHKTNQHDSMKEAYQLLLPYTRRMIIDQDNRKITILNKGNEDKQARPIKKVNVSNPYTYVDFDDINSFEVISDSPQIVNNNSFTSAAGGKYVAGDIGTIIGALSSLTNGTYITNLQIKLNLKSIENPCVMVNYFTRKTEVNSPMGKFLTEMFQKDVSRLEEVMRIISNDSSPKNDNPTSNIPVEELKKLKDLLDAGILSQEEFDAKKRQLLGL